MSKLTFEDKINLYNDRKSGLSIPSLVSKYNIRHDGVEYLIRLIDKLGLDILRTSKNRYYPPYKKEQIINRVLIGKEPRNSVAIEDYIYYYNYDRIKIKLKGLSPVNYRLQSSN